MAFFVCLKCFQTGASVCVCIAGSTDGVDGTGLIRLHQVPHVVAFSMCNHTRLVEFVHVVAEAAKRLSLSYATNYPTSQLAILAITQCVGVEVLQYIP